jgi:archaellum component FlaG (FlaF/FlaG flagellin family)
VGYIGCLLQICFKIMKNKADRLPKINKRTNINNNDKKILLSKYTNHEFTIYIKNKTKGKKENRKIK